MEFRGTQGLASAAAVLALLSFVGCGTPETGATVEGQVTVQGKPLTGGTLTFFPSEGPPVPTVVSQTGHYSCQLQPGKYRVTLVVGVQLPPGWEEGDRIPEPEVQIPLPFTNRKKTPLTATVVAGQTEPINFALSEP